MRHLGDFDTSTVVYGKFTTYRPSTGASYTLAGTPALSVYKDNSTTQSTSGVTLTADFDSVTGLNHFAIDTSSDGTFYSAGSFFDIVITTGTVDSVSVTGSVVGSFTIRKNSALKPTTAGRALDVSAGGEAGIDLANVGSPTTTLNLSGTTISTSQAVASVSGAVGSVTGAVGSVTGNVGGNVTGSVGSIATGGITEASFATTAGSVYPLGIVDQGTAQSATGTTLVLRSAAAFANDELIGATIVITGGSAGVGQSRTITDYVGATDTATVDTWTTTPTGTITYKIYATAAGSGGAGDATQAKQDTIIALIGTPAADLAADIAAVKAQTAAIETDTQDIQSRIPAALVGGRIDATVDGTGMEAGAVTAIQSGLATASALATTDGKVDSILADTADMQPKLGTPAGASMSADIAAVKSDTAAVLTDTGTTLDGKIDAIKAKTDSLTFTVAGQVDANTESINATTVLGTGTGGDLWRG